ncbi:hypothetical protein LXA43DRAFT_1058233 [Ganoderma leucocontextum]|nr:hypothetical protein LXA43DRAFT_1058233 [Ganoderma leucocontextum]
MTYLPRAVSTTLLTSLYDRARRLRRYVTTSFSTMTSLITSNESIVPSLWPQDLARVTHSSYDQHVRAGWRHFPPTADGILDWIEVIPTSGPNIRPGEKRVVYTTATLDPQLRKHSPTDMTFFVHGFIRALNLSPLGNWTTPFIIRYSKEVHAPSAVQHLTLVSGGHTAAFDAQLIAIAQLKDVISMLTGAEEIVHEGVIPQAIRLERNVFFKIRSDAEIDPPPSTQLTDENDPGHKARRIASRWSVSQLLPTYIRRPDGHDKAVPYHAFRIGDFVEVTVSPQVHSVRRDGQQQPTLQLVIKKLVKIWSAQEAKALLTRSTTTSSPMQKPSSSKPKVPPELVRMDTT